jgi:hypothetical protein
MLTNVICHSDIAGQITYPVLTTVNLDLGSEQALAPVRKLDNFAEGACFKLRKTQDVLEIQYLTQFSQSKFLYVFQM